MRDLSLALAALLLSVSVAAAQTATAPGLMAKASIWMRRRRRRARVASIGREAIILSGLTGRRSRRVRRFQCITIRWMAWLAARSKRAPVTRSCSRRYLRSSSAPRRNMKPAATIAAFRLQREVGGTEELGKAIRSCRAVRRSILRVSLHPELGTPGLAPRSPAAACR